MEKLLGEKLLDGTLIDFLTANSSDSTVLTEEEIGECVQQDTANVLWSFRQEEGKPEDEWIRFGRDGDIIVRQRLNDEKCIYYKFPKQNASSSYEWGLYAFGSGEEHYFLDWESEDYLVTVKRNAQKELIGIATYCMFADWIYGWQLYQEIDGEEIFRQYTAYVQNGTKYVGSAEPEYY